MILLKRLICIVTLALTFTLQSCSKNGPGTDEDVDIDDSTTQQEPYSWTEFVMGADLSYVNAIEDAGGTYKDSGRVKDPYAIFKSRGANTVRVRLWHNPQWQAGLNEGRIYSNLADVEKTIRRAKEAGMAVNLDLHYSDTWADPGNQETPEAWKGLAFDVLRDSVYAYTMSVLTYLKQRSLVPEMIQIGNETNTGMLFPAGQVVANNWTNFAALLNSGIKAVRDFSASSDIKPKIILHVAKLEDADWWSTQLMSRGVTDFDILGISHYYVYSNLSDMNAIESALRTVRTKSNKTVMIVETAYPWTSASADSYTNIFSGNSGFSTYGVSQTEQARYLEALTLAVFRAGGKGIMYWEPAWITSAMRDRWGTGSSWENNALFDFEGNALPAIQFFTTPLD